MWLQESRSSVKPGKRSMPQSFVEVVDCLVDMVARYRPPDPDASPAPSAEASAEQPPAAAGQPAGGAAGSPGAAAGHAGELAVPGCRICCLAVSMLRSASANLHADSHAWQELTCRQRRGIMRTGGSRQQNVGSAADLTPS